LRVATTTSNNRGSVIPVTVSSILNYIKYTELNKEVIGCRQKNKTVIPQSSDPIINEFYKVVSPNMAKWLTFQYDAAIKREYSRSEVNDLEQIL
jgi:hypothetical protein